MWRNNFIKKSSIYAIILLLILINIANSGSGSSEKFLLNKTKYFVNTSVSDIIIVPYDYPTIQDAIDNASDGDLIRVYNGTYYENLEIYKPVSIIGNGSQSTIIDGSEIGNPVNITSDDVLISGFEITNSYGPFYRGAIRIESSKNIIINNNTFFNNDYDLNLISCNALYEDIIIENNEFIEGRLANCGIWGVTESINISILNNIIRDKEIGILSYGSQQIIIMDNIIENCNKAIIFETTIKSDIINNEIIVTNRNLEVGIELKNSDNNKIIYNFINSTFSYMFSSGLHIQKSNNNIVKFNDFYLNLIAIRLEFSLFNRINWNNLMLSYSGFELSCQLSPGFYQFNYWRELKGPLGNVLGLGIIFCYPRIFRPWQKIFH